MKNTLKILGIAALAAMIVFASVSCTRGGGTAAAGSATTTDARSSSYLGENEIDRFLVEIDQIADQMADAYNRATQGDIMAVAQLEQLETRWETLTASIEGYDEGGMTADQAAKYAEIIAKFSSTMGF